MWETGDGIADFDEVTHAVCLARKTGLRISKAFLGAMTFGQDRTVGAPRDECRRMPDGTPMPAAT